MQIKSFNLATRWPYWSPHISLTEQGTPKFFFTILVRIKSITTYQILKKFPCRFFSPTGPLKMYFIDINTIQVAIKETLTNISPIIDINYLLISQFTWKSAYMKEIWPEIPDRETQQWTWNKLLWSLYYHFEQKQSLNWHWFMRYQRLSYFQICNEFYVA